VGTGLALAWLVLSPGRAPAVIADASVSVAGSVSSPSSDGGGFAAADATVAADATTLTARVAFNANADIGPGGARDQTGLFVATVTFAVDATAPYALSIDASVLAELTRVADAPDCGGNAVFSGIFGDSNLPLAGGSLGFGATAVLGDGGDAAAREYRASGQARIVGVPGEAPVMHMLTFTSSAAVVSAGCEVAVRGGLDNGSTLDCSACGYPGSPPRDLAADGLLVRVTLAPACGDGRVDAAIGEACDLGARNGADACCDAQCRLRPAGAACAADGSVCTDDLCDGVGPECAYAANSAACDDGLFCTGADSCGGGTCSVHAGSPCAGPDDDADCRESCDEARGACDAPDPAGSACGAGDSACTEEACDGAGTCVATPRDGPCDDGDACTHGDGCADGLCRAGAPGCDACQRCAADGRCEGAPCTPSPSPTPTATPAPPCAGDCNADGQVAVDEVVTLVGIALGSAETARCARGDTDGDGGVSISELIAAVNALLDGCASEVGATPASPFAE